MSLVKSLPQIIPRQKVKEVGGGGQNIFFSDAITSHSRRRMVKLQLKVQYHTFAKLPQIWSHPLHSNMLHWKTKTFANLRNNYLGRAFPWG